MKRSQTSSRPVMRASGRSGTLLKRKNQWPRAMWASMRSKMVRVGILSRTARRSTASGKSLAKRGGDAGTAIVSDDRTAVDAEVVHELEDVAGHGAFVVAGSGFFRCAVSAEVGGDDAEVLGEDGDLVTPRKPGFWEAVEQHDGWSVGFAGFDEVHFEVVDGDGVVGEFGRHGGIRGGLWAGAGPSLRSG